MRAGIFGETLRGFRTRRGMTQQELADFSTVSVRAIRDLESGRVSRPRKATVRLLADALRLDGDSRCRLESTVSALQMTADGRPAPAAVPEPVAGGSGEPGIAQGPMPDEIAEDEEQDDAHKVLLAYLPKHRARSQVAREFASYADAVRSLAERLNLPGGPIVIVMLNPDSLNGLSQAGAAAAN